MNWSLALQSFATLFSVVDPIATVPLFLSMTKGDTPEQRHRYVRNAVLTATAILIFFLFFGQAVFRLFDVTLFALRIAGGIILLIIALDLLKATHTGVRIEKAEEREGMEKTDISITPLGIPMLAGPGAISSVMVMASAAPGVEGTLTILAVILAVGLVTWLILRSSDIILRLLGVTGINVASRLMGLLLLAMAVQYLIDGARDVYPVITGERPS